MSAVTLLNEQVNQQFSTWIESTTVALGELTVYVKPVHLVDICLALRDQPNFEFKVLIDVCGVDYLHYGLSDWETDAATESGFSRGVETTLTSTAAVNEGTKERRFAVVYHLLSLSKNHRIRLVVNIPNHGELMVDSVTSVWPAANWYEREAFDLFGILFKGHADLRRILTDYGFVGHPFRKDFPLIGRVEARYDATTKRVVYEPVSIEPRVLEPKVIRRDSRYLDGEKPDVN